MKHDNKCLQRWSKTAFHACRLGNIDRRSQGKTTKLVEQEHKYEQMSNINCV